MLKIIIIIVLIFLYIGFLSYVISDIVSNRKIDKYKEQIKKKENINEMKRLVDRFNNKSKGEYRAKYSFYQECIFIYKDISEVEVMPLGKYSYGDMDTFKNIANILLNKNYFKVEEVYYKGACVPPYLIMEN